MIRPIKMIYGAYRSLKSLVDPASEGNPYERDEFIKETVETHHSLNLFSKKRFAFK